MTDGVLLRETLKDSDLDKYRYVCFNLTSDRSCFELDKYRC